MSERAARGKRPVLAVRITVVMLIVLGARAAVADVVVLDNGESLSGDLSRIRENTLIFRTSLQGQMVASMSEVRSLSTTANLYIAMMDGTVHYGRLGLDSDVQVVYPLDGGTPTPIDAKAIKETLSIPSPPVGEKTDGQPDWRIDAGLGAQWRSDGAGQVEPVIRLDMTGRSDDWTVSGDALVERSDPDEFPAYLRGQGALRRDTGALASPFVGAGIERDLDRGLHLRSQITLGLYRDFYAEEGRSFSGAIGLMAEQERRRDDQASKHSTMRDDRLNLQLGLRYYRLFARRQSLSEALFFYPAITAVGDFRMRSETSYAFPITERLRLRLDLIIDYESDPLVGGLNRWNATVGAGVNMAF